jgi:hypothetical protein
MAETLPPPQCHRLSHHTWSEGAIYPFERSVPYTEAAGLPMCAPYLCVYACLLCLRAFVRGELRTCTMHTCMHTHIHTCAHIYTHTFRPHAARSEMLLTYIHRYTHTYTHTHIPATVRCKIRNAAYTHTHVNTHTCAYTHTFRPYAASSGFWKCPTNRSITPCWPKIYPGVLR